MQNDHTKTNQASVTQANHPQFDNAALKRFSQIFIAVFLLVSAVVFVFKRTDLFPWIGACYSDGYDADHYMAYCHSTRYGDYEHYALYHGLEAQSVDALKAAEVLFLGNSNTQYAFSTDAVETFFNERQLKHYVMGFGQGAQSPVAEALIKRHQLKPRILVVNLDPFFSTETNGTFQRVLNNPDGIKTEFERKQWLQKIQKSRCAKRDSFGHAWLCNGDSETIYRNRINGHWNTDYYREDKKIATSNDELRFLAVLNNAEVAARAFMRSLAIEPACIVATVTPRTDTPLAFAKALQSRLGIAMVFPEIGDLTTIDHSHLSPDSAKRWSEAFLVNFDDNIKRCFNHITHAQLPNQ